MTKTVYLTDLALSLNHALDTGYNDATVAEVKQQLRAGKGFDFLEEQLGRALHAVENVHP